MEIHWYGTASVKIISGAGELLFDPFVPLKGADHAMPVEGYDGSRTIFVTHGHFDHIVNLPEIIRRNPGAVVYCTDAPRTTLLKKGVPEQNLRQLRYGDTVEVSGFTVRVFHGRHAVLPGVSPKLLKRLLFNRRVGNLPHALREHRVCVENDETVLYEISAEGKTISLMGSLNLRDDVDYPTGSDLLILPYNGWEDNLPPALKVIGRLKPKHVLLDHYDNAFPPLTAPLDTAPFLKACGVPAEEARFRESYFL